MHCGAMLPPTDTVGATAVGGGLNRFIDLLLTESMIEAYRDRFLRVLRQITRAGQLVWRAIHTVRKEEQESLCGHLMFTLPEPHPTPARPRRLPKKPITAEAVSRC